MVTLEDFVTDSKVRTTLYSKITVAQKKYTVLFSSFQNDPQTQKLEPTDIV